LAGKVIKKYAFSSQLKLSIFNSFVTLDLRLKGQKSETQNIKKNEQVA